MEFGIMFFSNMSSSSDGSGYQLLLESAKLADSLGFCCAWTPERHFHEFGGLFSNPALTSAALSTITERLQLRAGSLISPLHHTLRIAEEWSMVDNLSHGRAAISFGSGWNVDDFVFFPERYSERQEWMYRQIDEIKALWAGRPVKQKNGSGNEVDVTLFPRPVQRELPVWITSSGNSRTFSRAGARGANLLTHLIGQNTDQLAEKIELYRDSRRQNGFDPGSGKVSLMLHTFLGSDVETVKKKVRKPFREYLRSAIDLEQVAARDGGVISGGHSIKPHEISQDALEELLDLTFERYFSEAALMGTPASCVDLVHRLQSIAVDEIACLIDFVDDREGILRSLEYVAELKELSSEVADRIAQDHAAEFSAEIDV